MDLIQAVLALVAATATSAYAVHLAREVERARLATGTHTLSRTIRRARYEITQQKPVDIAARIAAELSLIPPLEIKKNPDIEAVIKHDDAISEAAGLVTEATDELRACLVQGWRLVANPIIRPRSSARTDLHLFDAIVEGPPGRLPCLVEVKIIRHNQSTASALSEQLYAMNKRTKNLEAVTDQEFQDLLLAVVDDPQDAMNVRNYLGHSQGIVAPSNTFIGSYQRNFGLDFATAWPPFARPVSSKDAVVSHRAGGLTA